MDFRSIYQHGFARVAACTGRVAIADPPANAEPVLRQARACAEEGVAVARLPRAVPDRLLDRGPAAPGRACSTASRRRSPRWSTGSADLLPLLVVGAPLRHRNRVYNCAVVVHRGRVLGVAPKSYLPTYREFYEGRQIALGRRRARRDPHRRRRRAVRPRPAVRRRGRPRPRRPRRGLRGHVGPDPAQRRGGAGRRDGAAQPLRAARSPSAAPRTASCCAGRRPRAAWPPTSTPPPARASRPPTCPGTARR